MRVVALVVLMAACAASSRAGDLAASVARQAQQVAAQQTAARQNVKRPAHHPFSTIEIWTGAALMAGGMVAAFDGFGHPTGPVDSELILTNPAAFPHRRTLGYAGIGIAAAGAALAWHGVAHLSVQADRTGLTVRQRVSF